MRAWSNVPWVVFAVLGCTAAGCGAESADESGAGPGSNPGAGGAGWLEGAEENPFPGPEAEPNDLKSPAPNGAGGGTSSGGSGGAASPPDPLATLCPSYDPLAYSHTLTASARDPGNTASATRARELLGAGQPPVPGSVRSTDFVSYYGRPTLTDVAPGALGGLVELRTRKIEGNDIPTQLELYVGVVAGAVTRPPVVLTLLVDATLSDAALARAKATIAGLGKGLQANDRVTLMTTAPDFVPVVKDLGTGATDEVAQLAEQLVLGTGTVAARLPAAYAAAKAKTVPSGSWNRVVVIGDGEEDANAPDYSQIDAEAANSGIFLTTIGVAPGGTYGDALLYRLSHQGRGRYLYIDDVNEPGALFPARFAEIFGLARDKVRIRVDLPSFMRALDPEPAGGGGSPRDRYLAPGEWAQFVFHLAVCSKEVLVTPGFDTQLVNVTVESTLPDGTEAPNPLVLSSLPVKKAPYAVAPELDKMVAIQAFVDALKYPMDSRFLEAKARLEPLTASPGPELLALLGKHPSFPKQ